MCLRIFGCVYWKCTNGPYEPTCLIVWTRIWQGLVFQPKAVQLMMLFGCIVTCSLSKSPIKTYSSRCWLLCDGATHPRDGNLEQSSISGSARGCPIFTLLTHKNFQIILLMLCLHLIIKNFMELSKKCLRLPNCKLRYWFDQYQVGAPPGVWFF